MRQQIERNRKGLKIRSDSEQMVDMPQKQRLLTQEWILPAKDQIVADISLLRKKIDSNLKRRDDVRNELREQRQGYPIGLCRQIRDEIMNELGKHHDRSSLGMRAIKQFTRNGGVVHPFWATEERKYFQNAIQMGTAILDAAHDTNHPSDDPVVLYPSIEESPFKKIERFEDIAEVAEEYWDFDVYPNVYLPAVAPLYPLLGVDKEARQKWDNKGRKSPSIFLIPSASILIDENFKSGRGQDRFFTLAHDFITKGPYSVKRLPKQYAEALFRPDPSSRLGRLVKLRPDLFEASENPDELEASFSQFFVTKNLGEILKQFEHIGLIGDLVETFRKEPLVTVR